MYSAECLIFSNLNKERWTGGGVCGRPAALTVPSPFCSFIKLLGFRFSPFAVRLQRESLRA